MIRAMLVNLAATPVNLFAALNVVGLVLLSLLSLRLAQREGNKLHRSIYLHWTLGFFLMIWDRVPIVLGALGMGFVPERLLTVYFFVFIAYISGLILLTRGLLLLFTKNRWLLNIIPLSIISAGTVLTAVTFIWLGSPSIGLWLAKIFTYITVVMNVGVSMTILTYRRKTLENWQVKAGWALMAAAWIVMLAARTYFFRLFITSSQSWFNLVQQVPQIYQALMVAQVLMFCGIFLMGHHRESPPFHGVEAKALLAADVLMVGLLFALISAGTHAGSLIAASGRAEVAIGTKTSADIISGRNFVLEVYINSPVAFNTTEGKIMLPKDLLPIRVDKSASDIPLWIEEPKIDPAGNIAWSGGIPGGATGKVRIFEVELKAGNPMHGMISFADISVLANDGNGTPLQVTVRPFILAILPGSVGAADLSGDGLVDIKDLSRLLAHWGEEGVSMNDLNGNGRVDLPDLSMLLSSFSLSNKGTRAFIP